MNSVQQDACSEAFRQTELLIFSTVHEFTAAYGGTFDEWIEYANPIFVSAFQEHDPSRSSFPTTLRWYIWKQLLDICRKKLKHKGKLVYCDLDMLAEQAIAPPEFNMAAFMFDLNEDGQRVADLVLRTPRSLAVLFENAGTNPNVLRELLREYLSGLGWSMARTRRAFEEIRRGLREYAKRRV